MGLLSAAWSREFPAVAFNTIWPQCMVATFAVTNTVGSDLALAVSVAHMADPAYRIATSLCHGHHFLDREVLSMMRVRNKTAWQVDAATPPELLGDDFMVIPEGMQAGDTHAFTRLPPSQDPAHGHQPLDGLRNLTLLVAADSATSAPMVQQAMQAGARARGAALTAEVHQMGEAVRAVASGAAAAAAGGGGGGGAGGLDLLYLGLGPSSSKGTLETDAHEWERLFLSACKAPYYYVAKALPALRKASAPAQIVIVTPSPSCHPDSFVGGVPYAVMLTMRSLYVVGMAEEFNGSSPAREYVRVNGLWDGATERDPPPHDALSLLATRAEGPPPPLRHVEGARVPLGGQHDASGMFYALDVSRVHEKWTKVSTRDYTKQHMFLDYTTMWYADTAVS